MSYSAGILRHRITVLQREEAEDGIFGKGSAGISYAPVTQLWAAVDFSRGLKPMREGTLDAYDRVMIRTRWCPLLTRESRILYEDRTYQIESFHGDRQTDSIQITAVELVGVNPC